MWREANDDVLRRSKIVVTKITEGIRGSKGRGKTSKARSATKAHKLLKQALKNKGTGEPKTHVKKSTKGKKKIKEKNWKNVHYRYRIKYQIGNLKCLKKKTY